ncbi:uncharacterized protein T551_03294 [Pneumocystis jirovecii RU7]|uniref:Uncharacterized protein n=1 Tax=Pneumocystis jirovecii (strain RU7) TaxID=1408657 RepID=A0A0W4ZEM0_PNEJ7|nr:uncharacterized protein T551_03294 [Pneumocystis jirovecii RU7]KTW26832.1 hypothetical protein T551_03294 [Pneumocystis jirovecii RU7]
MKLGREYDSLLAIASTNDWEQQIRLEKLKKAKVQQEAEKSLKEQQECEKERQERHRQQEERKKALEQASVQNLVVKPVISEKSISQENKGSLPHKKTGYRSKVS